VSKKNSREAKAATLAALRKRQLKDERTFFVRVLKQAKGNASQAARDLDISNQYLQRCLTKFGLRGVLAQVRRLNGRMAPCR